MLWQCFIVALLFFNGLGLWHNAFGCESFTKRFLVALFSLGFFTWALFLFVTEILKIGGIR